MGQEDLDEILAEGAETLAHMIGEEKHIPGDRPHDNINQADYLLGKQGEIKAGIGAPDLKPATRRAAALFKSLGAQKNQKRSGSTEGFSAALVAPAIASGTPCSTATLPSTLQALSETSPRFQSISTSPKFKSISASPTR